MGKLVENERLKLRAAYYNNLGVGLFLGGLLIPYLSIVRRAGTIIESLTDGEPLTFAVKANSIASLFAMGMAFYGGRSMRRLANSTIEQIADDEPKNSA